MKNGSILWRQKQIQEELFEKLAMVREMLMKINKMPHILVASKHMRHKIYPADGRNHEVDSNTSGKVTPRNSSQSECTIKTRERNLWRLIAASLHKENTPDWFSWKLTIYILKVYFGCSFFFFYYYKFGLVSISLLF